MKEKILIGLLFLFLAISGYGQGNEDEKTPLAPEKKRKPENVQSFSYKYSLEELKDNFSEDILRYAVKQNESVKETNYKGKWKPTPESIDSHQAPEWFKDLKFGMFIDWGLWSVAGWAPKKEKGAMYPDWYEFRLDVDSAFIKYHEKNWGKDFKRDDFIPLFTDSKYQPQKLTEIAKDAGMKYIVPFSKHHGGFCLWSSSFTQRDAMDMGPKKDLIKPLVESCKKEGLKFGFYFSIEEWEYPLIGSNGELQNRGWGWRGGIKPYTPDLEKKVSGKIAVKDYATDYLVPQATEFIDMYDPDLIWYDGDMSSISAEGLRTYEIAAYFYNKAEGRKEVAVNDRYGTQDKKWLRSVRGDFFTNEYGDMEKEAKKTTHAWEACWGISQSFGYNWQDTDDNVISSKEFIDKFVDIVAHGGNLLLIVNLDGEGALPKIQENRLRDIGKWLKVNGEGIYSTRPFTRQLNGSVAFTRSKDNQYVYAILKEWPGQELKLKGIQPAKNSKIEMLGYGEPLEWINGQDGMSVKLPSKLQDKRNRPCLHAWILKIKLDVSAAMSQSPIQFVDPLIGTATSDTESSIKHIEAGLEIKGQTFPAVGRPFGMTQWTPETRTTETKCISPYYYNDKLITGFRGSHWMSGSCTQDYGSVTVMPFSTNRIDTLKTFPPVSGYSHKNETTTPAYYRVLLENFNIQAELTATVRSGMLRFEYSGKGKNYLQIRANSDEEEGRIWFEKDRNEIIGYNPVHRIYQGIGQSAGFSGYFVIRFDKPFKVMSQTSYPQQMVVGFENEKTIQVKIGTSFTSIEAARNNLDQEITDWDFESIREASEVQWNQMLGRVEVEGDSDQDKIKFYTALYHCFQLPRTSSDIDGSYQGFAQDTSIHKAEDFVYYDDFSMWDTYRALHPLLALLEPKRSLDMVKSLVAKAGQGGWMPIFPAWGNYTAAMIGDHVSTMISDAYAKGIRDFDTETAWKYMRKNAFEHPSKEEYLDGKGRRALTSYLKYGYIPLEDPVLEAFHVNEQVSRTLEYAFDDFALAQFAKGLGKKDDYTALMKRSQNYRNVFDTQTNYVRGRHANGRWIELFEPFARASFICEGTPFQYTWYVPHDVPGLVELMGGREAFLKQLNTFFDDGHYWHGNETDQQAPYLFAMVGDLRKTQEWVRRIADEEYATSPGGLSGNEDAGQMSAWLVYTMMGFYPVCPATDQYIMGVPMFKKITVNLENGKKLILNAPENSAEKPYIQSVSWNGKTCRDNLASHLEMMKGGVIDYEMTEK